MERNGPASMSDDAEHKMDNKKAGNSLCMEKHMDVLQACVMLPTPSWPMMSARFLSAELKAKKDTDSKVWSWRFLPRQQQFPVESEVCSTVVWQAILLKKSLSRKQQRAQTWNERVTLDLDQGAVLSLYWRSGSICGRPQPFHVVSFWISLGMVKQSKRNQSSRSLSWHCWT